MIGVAFHDDAATLVRVYRALQALGTVRQAA